MEFRLLRNEKKWPQEFTHPDHLGTPRLIEDDQQRTLWRNDNTEPFGDSAPNEDPSGLGATEFPLGLSLYYRDKETASLYAMYRDAYSPGIGRFPQSDPIGLSAGPNTYAYVNGNPVNSSDLDGLCPCGIPADVIAAARADRRNWSALADRTDVNSGFPAGTFKCNLFADTQYEGAGYNLPNIGGSSLSRALGRYPPGAQSLASSGYPVPGWPVVSGPPQPGDLIAYGGHVGIVTGPRTSISAAPSGVVENDWGFRQGQSPIIRRCSCQ